MFNLPSLDQIDIHAEFSFLKKVLDDLHFTPKELIWLASRIQSSPEFRLLSDADLAFVSSVLSRLTQAYNASYPHGRHAN
jgi:hypothetical protein